MAHRPGGRPARPALACRIGCRVTLLVGLLVVSLGNAAPADPFAHYAALERPRALAMLPDAPDAPPGISHGRANDLEAALDALHQCQALNAAPCELRWLNDESITTGAAIKARVPAEPHPLYLWRYRSRVATVYVAGTLHILKPALHPLPAQLEAAFTAADRLVVEVDLTRMAAADLQRLTLERARLPAGERLSDLLGPARARELEARLARYGMTPAMFEPTGPAFVTQQLVVARLMALGYDSASGVEEHYLARRGSRPVAELESVEAQLALLFDHPIETQLAVFDDALAMEASVEPVLAQMITAWLAGDDAALDAALAVQAYPDQRLDDYRHALLDARHDGMAQGIVRELDRPGTALVLIGAAHVTGPGNVIEVLAGLGIHGERIRSDQSL